MESCYKQYNQESEVIKKGCKFYSKNILPMTVDSNNCNTSGTELYVKKCAIVFFFFNNRLSEKRF